MVRYRTGFEFGQAIPAGSIIANRSTAGVVGLLTALASPTTESVKLTDTSLSRSSRRDQ